MVLYYVQLISVAVVLFGNFLCGISPYFLLTTFYKNDSNGCRRNRLSSYFVYFGGGFFMSICFLILQPRASVEYEKHYHSKIFNQRRQCESDLEKLSPKENHLEGFPIPEFIILCIFFTVFAVEELLQFLLFSSRKKDVALSRKIPFCSCAKRHTECSRTFKADNPAEQTLYGLEKNFSESNKGTDVQELSETKRPSEETVVIESRLLQSSIMSQPIPNYGAVTNVTPFNANQPIPALVPPIVFDEDGKVTVVQPSMNQVDYRPFTSCLLLAVAISFYSICQGISLGHLKDSFTWTHAAQYLHQFILSFVTGTVITQDNKTSLPIVCYVGSLSIMCPLGISVTMIFDKVLMTVSHLTKAIISAILCGSLLYLTFFDLIRGNTLHSAPSLGKFIFFTVGALTIALLEYIFIIN